MHVALAEERHKAEGEVRRRHLGVDVLALAVVRDVDGDAVFCADQGCLGQPFRLRDEALEHLQLIRGP
jgi:hypothetical protein